MQPRAQVAVLSRADMGSKRVLVKLVILGRIACLEACVRNVNGIVRGVSVADHADHLASPQLVCLPNALLS